MSTDQTTSQLIINKLTKEQYEALTSPSETELYLTPDTTEQDIADAVSTHNTNSSAHSSLFDSKVTANTAITASTTKKLVTYDSKGLVTGGSALASSDVTTALGYTPMANTVKYGADLNYSNSQLQLKDQDGNLIGSAVTIESSPAIDNSTITTNTSGQLQASSLVNLTATVTELNYVDGVTSSIQTQLNSKLSSVPQATSTKLGGIIASEKTSTETQEVKIDSSTGKLYVQPGGGGGSVDIDNLSITKNTSDQIQTVGVINQNSATTSIKTWVGTKAEFDAITTKDSNTIYTVTDDSSIVPTTSGYHPPLFQPIWSDNLISDACWLRADTFSWQDGTTYNIAYDKLVEEYNASTSVEETEGTSWTQPVLTANGTLGTDAFAVSGGSTYSSTYDFYKAVNGDTSSYWATSSGVSLDNAYFIFATSTKTVLKSFSYKSNDSSYNATGLSIYGSNDNSTYTLIQSYTGIDTTKLTWTFTVDNNTAYKYYKIKCDGYNTYGFNMSSLVIDALSSEIVYKRSANNFKITTSEYEDAVLSKYNKDGIAWVYILDETNKRFKLPRTKWGFKGLRGLAGNDIYESLPNITGDILGQRIPYAVLSGTNNAFYWNSNTTSYYSSPISGGDPYNISFDASRSSSVYQDNAPVQERATQMYLYMYIGEFTQSALENVAGVKANLINNKADINLNNSTNPVISAPYLKTTYVNGTSGYNIWSNGYCEQWGYNYVGSSTASVTYAITFLKQFANTNYLFIFGQMHSSGGYGYWGSENYTDRTTIGTKVMCSSSGFYGYYWKVCGYLAEGEY